MRTATAVLQPKTKSGQEALAGQETRDMAMRAEEARLPAHEEVAERAYSYWLERGCPEGCPEEDWYRAESELRTHGSVKTGQA